TTHFDLRALVAGAIRQAETELDQSLSFPDGEGVTYHGDATLLTRVAYHLAVLGLQRRQGASLMVSSEPDGASVQLVLPGGWTAPAQDVWLEFCATVAAAHAGSLEHRPDGLLLVLGRVP